MRAITVNEKVNFTEDSDPIGDMVIGGVVLNDVYDEIENEAANKWEKFLIDNLVGKTITGQMMRWRDTGHEWKKFTIVVNKLAYDKKERGFEEEISVIDENGDYYTINGEEKIIIKNES